VSPLDDLFADLRGLMQRDRLDAAARADLWLLLRRAHALDPAVYADVFVPYASGFPHHLVAPLASTHDLDHLARAIDLAPFALFSYRTHPASRHTIEDVLGSPLMARVSELVLDGARDEHVTLLAKKKHFPDLTRLDLSGAQLGYDGAVALGKNRTLKKLTHLDLSGTFTAPNAAQRFTYECGFNRLTHLTLSHSPHIGDEAVTGLTHNHAFFRLEHLSLRRAELHDQGVVALAEAPNLTRLRHLDLSGNHINARGARALATSTLLDTVTHLDLSYNYIPDAGIRHFIKAPTRPNLTSLDLTHNLIESDGLRQLAASDAFRNLRRFAVGGHLCRAAIYDLLEGLDEDLPLTHLAVTEARVAGKAVQQLVDSPHLPELTSLDLSGCPLPVKAIRALAQGDALPNLTCLRLSNCGLDDDHARELGRTSRLSTLTSLDLSHNAFGSPGARHILHDRALPRLGELDLRGDHIRIQRDPPLAISLPNLRSLHLDGAVFAGARDLLATTPLLRSVSLRGGLRDEDLDALSTLAHLRHLHVPVVGSWGSERRNLMRDDRLAFIDLVLSSPGDP
jgi:Leucine-rich repeat (LRR) protein